MKKYKIILSGLILFLALFSIYRTEFVLADTPNYLDVYGNSKNVKIQAKSMVNYRFQQKTQLRINSSVNLCLNIYCDALHIGNKTFEIEIEANGDRNMTMTCTEEQAELGLLNGEINQNRNRNRFRFLSRFVVQLQANGSIQAKLKLKAENEYQNGNWAYYDEGTETWIPVQTTLKDGFLITETDHFSTWTVINLESDNSGLIIIGVVVVSVLSVIAVAGIILWKKKRK